MKVFLDTNVLLDIFLRRPGFLDDAKQIWSLVESRKIQGAVAAISFNNIHYVMARQCGRPQAMQAVTLMLCALKMVTLEQHVIQAAVLSHFPDFEDAIQYYSALSDNADCIITRDHWQIPSPLCPILSPAEFLTEYRPPEGWWGTAGNGRIR